MVSVPCLDVLQKAQIFGSYWQLVRLHAFETQAVVITYLDILTTVVSALIHTEITDWSIIAFPLVGGV